MKTEKKLGIGKLRHEFLEKLLKNFVSDLKVRDKRVVMGSRIGEDAAVIDMGQYYLVAKTDPITYATDEIGYYVVNINVNDVVCTGATPKWFQSTILLPEKSTSTELVQHIFKNIHDTCESKGVAVIGGHTEVTAGLDRPIVIGSLLGEVEKEKLVNPSNIREGDALVLTKGVFIEGTSIIGREKQDILKKKGYDEKFANKCKNYLYNPGISVYKEAKLANEKFKIKAMHDPTEGGIACGIAELAMVSNLGVLLDQRKIKILPEPLELSTIFKLNPLNTISSGTLLIAIEEKYVQDLVDLLAKNNVVAEKIGVFVSKEKGLLIKDYNGAVKPFEYSETDEITKLF